MTYMTIAHNMIYFEISFLVYNAAEIHKIFYRETAIFQIKKYGNLRYFCVENKYVFL